MAIKWMNELAAYQVGNDPHGWQRLEKECVPLTRWGLQTLQEGGLLAFAGTILRESRYICKDHRSLFANFYAKKTHVGSSVCERLHFFSDKGIIPEDFLLEPEKFQKSYMGFSVIRPVAVRCIGRTVIDPYTLGHSYDGGFYCLRTKFQTHLNGRLLSVKGYPYLSQDTDATVCAHATLWGACRYLSERYSTYGELLPYDLVNLTA